VRHKGGVLELLCKALESQWRRYRKRLRQCQRRFSQEAVHDSRVETRRLLATVELLCAFIPERELKKARRALKKHLDAFDRLRDTQVQLTYVGHLLHEFPAARGFHDWLCVFIGHRSSSVVKTSAGAARTGSHWRGKIVSTPHPDPLPDRGGEGIPFLNGHRFSASSGRMLTTPIRAVDERVLPFACSGAL